MSSLKLDSRLSEILSHIKGRSFADIGCDHGKLAVAAVLRKQSDKVIATDISAASLDKTRHLVENLKLSDKIFCRVGDGLSVVDSGEVDTVVIAGLGGDEITKILQDAKAGNKVFNNFVVSPNTHAEKVRKEAVAQGFDFVRDYMIYCDKKFYTVIVLERVSENQKTENEKKVEKKSVLSAKQIEFGKEYAQSSVFKKWAEKEIKRIDKLISKSENSELLKARLIFIEGAYEDNKC